MMFVNPVVADAMKRAGEEVPATGIIAMSNGTPIACAAASGDENETKRTIGKAAALFKSAGFNVVRGNFSFKGTAGTETMSLSIGSIPFGSVTIRSFAGTDAPYFVNFKAETPSSMQSGLTSLGLRVAP